VLFEAEAGSMSAWGGYDRAENRLIFVERTGFFDSRVWLGDRTGPQQRIDLPTDAWYSWEAGWLAVRGRTAWTAGETTFPPMPWRSSAWKNFSPVIAISRWCSNLVHALRSKGSSGPPGVCC
jgi:hypothetical protein